MTPETNFLVGHDQCVSQRVLHIGPKLLTEQMVPVVDGYLYWVKMKDIPRVRAFDLIL